MIWLALAAALTCSVLMRCAGGDSNRANPVHTTSCVRLSYRETVDTDLVFSNNPAEVRQQQAPAHARARRPGAPLAAALAALTQGISVLYDGSTTDEKILPRFGVTTQSQVQVRARGAGS